MKVSARPAVLIKPDALRKNIRLSPPTSVTDILSSLSGDQSRIHQTRVQLPLHEICLRNLAVPQRDQGALQNAFGVDAAGIDADRLADVDLGPSFVDVSVQAEQRLMLLDDVDQRLAAGMNLRRQPHLVNDLQILIELGTGIERR